VSPITPENAVPTPAPLMAPRRVFHIVAGSTIPVAGIYAPYDWLMWGLVAASLLAITFDVGRVHWPQANRLIMRWLPIFKEKEANSVTGATFMLVAALVAFALLNREVAVLGFLFLAVGDPAAALVGTRARRGRIFGKSVAGTAAFAVTASVAGSLVAIHPVVSLTWWLYAGAVVAAVTELLPLRVDDNVSIPLVSGAAMTLMVSL
jgi:glycerol-3-phosphate acyltransferase PlsY